jgi:hypothetical protein
MINHLPRHILPLALLVALVAMDGRSAAEIQTFTYDAKGRLTA